MNIIQRFFIASSVLALTVRCENPELPLGKYLYEDLKCVANTEGDNHPAYYKCDVSSKDKCIFEGKKLLVGEEIKDNGTDVYCRSHCSCNEDGTFDCAEDDCFEQIPDGCRLKDSLTECCQVVDCEHKPQHNCTYDGKTYEEGKTFYPEHSCHTCLCQDGFNGKIEAPHCIKRRCLEQIFHMDILQQKCAAVYFLKDLCCPATWVCNKGQKIERINPNNETKVSCKFGDNTVPLGHGFETTVRPYSKIVKVRCECTLPPFITCLELPGQ